MNHNKLQVFGQSEHLDRGVITFVGKLKRFLGLTVVLSMTACAMAPVPAPAPEPVPAKPKTTQTFEPVISPEPVEPPKQAVQQPLSSTVSKPVVKAPAPKTAPVSKPVDKPVASPSKPVAKTPAPKAAPVPKPVDKPVVSPKPVAVTVQPEVSADLQQAIEIVLEPEPETTQIEAKLLSLSQLPMRFGTSWTLDRLPNPVTKTTECLLISDPVTIADGYENTKVQLLLTTAMLYVKTGSNIDLNYPQSGLQIDDGPIWAFDSVIKETSVKLDTHYEEAVSRFGSGKTVAAHLGFWPTWPMTETREARFSLKGMEDSISKLTECANM